MCAHLSWGACCAALLCLRPTLDTRFVSAVTWEATTSLNLASQSSCRMGRNINLQVKNCHCLLGRVKDRWSRSLYRAPALICVPSCRQGVCRQARLPPAPCVCACAFRCWDTLIKRSLTACLLQLSRLSKN